jgi:hypothetical protein
MTLRLLDSISDEMRWRKLEQELAKLNADIIQILKRLPQRQHEYIGHLPHPEDAFYGVTGGDPGGGGGCVNSVGGVPLVFLSADDEPAFVLGISSEGCLVKIPVAECE